ncbi:PREDICTED: uncharacterized protein LOC109226363 [Nicotiana attenuata]|uniref:uncharacterized protein LOC109226363 n=1 Tax=Nicotiana attenuata TaxID=49451 RepID=UPI000905D412|nr:PREDICTED: uncharacterized protein LOC109226363 [Nicotiana attenuata]
MLFKPFLSFMWVDSVLDLENRLLQFYLNKFARVPRYSLRTSLCLVKYAVIIVHKCSVFFTDSSGITSLTYPCFVVRQQLRRYSTILCLFKGSIRFLCYFDCTNGTTRLSFDLQLEISPEYTIKRRVFRFIGV